MIKIELLQAFTLVAELGGISKAADRLSLTAMAMSKKISNLESQLGEPLFERTNRSLVLTEFGKDFKLEADKVLIANQSMNNWLESSQGKVSGTIRLLCQTPDMLKDTILPWLSEFSRLYPEINFALDVKESIIDVKQDDYDIYWGIGGYLGEHFPGLKQRKMWSSQYGIYASPDYLQLHGIPTTLEEIENHFIVSYLHNKPSNVMVMQQKGEPVYKMLKEKVATVAGHIELAIDGMGLINAANNTKEIKESVADGKLIPVLQNYWWDEAEIFVYFHDVRHPQPKVRAFLDFFLEKRQDWKLE